MQRGIATKGQIAKTVAGAEAIEIKATIPDHQVTPALRRFGLTTRNDEERYIYFFDTPKLDLLAAGIIARARRIVGDGLKEWPGSQELLAIAREVEALVPDDSPRSGR